jgi:hypothetical protein
MDATVARNIARASLAGKRNRFGEAFIDHVERVAATVPAEARPVALLHDVLEHSETPVEELWSAGLTPGEFTTLDILTREPGESYEAHILRIAYAAGDEGAIARTVKLADLADHLNHREMPHAAPPYGWASLHIKAGQARLERRAFEQPEQPAA